MGRSRDGYLIRPRIRRGGVALVYGSPLRLTRTYRTTSFRLSVALRDRGGREAHLPFAL